MPIHPSPEAGRGRLVYRRQREAPDPGREGRASAGAKDKAYKISDRRGLYLQVTPKNRKGWRYKYRHERSEQRLKAGLCCWRQHQPPARHCHSQNTGLSSRYYLRMLYEYLDDGYLVDTISRTKLCWSNEVPRSAW